MIQKTVFESNLTRSSHHFHQTKIEMHAQCWCALHGFLQKIMYIDIMQNYPFFNSSKENVISCERTFWALDN